MPVDVSQCTPVSIFSTVTFTPTMAAPCSSVTVPMIRPVVSCATAGTNQTRIGTTANKKRRHLRDGAMVEYANRLMSVLRPPPNWVSLARLRDGVIALRPRGHHDLHVHPRCVHVCKSRL